MPQNRHESNHEALEDFKPLARTEDLVTTETKDEVLVYDQVRHHIHHLNVTAAAVWRMCDGQRTVAQIAREADIEEDAVWLALRKLADTHLLDGEIAAGPGGRQSRRSFLKKAGIATIPAIVSTTAPIAKAAASGGSGCSPLPYGGCFYQCHCEAHQFCDWGGDFDNAGNCLS